MPIAPEKRICNCDPSRETDRDWTLEAAAPGLDVDLTKVGRFPTSKDLRAKWWDVGDQLETGSCVGWAAADGVIRWHMVQNKMLRENQKLSVRALWMSSKESDEFTDYPTTFLELPGTSLKAALDIARKFGVVPEEEVPFHGALSPRRVEDFYTIAAQRRIASYVNLGRAEFASWRYWLANKGPILTRLVVDDTFRHAPKTGALKAYLAATKSGGHAICLVGYDNSSFIVRNSWGTKWGDGGFGYATESYAAEFLEAYGVSL